MMKLDFQVELFEICRLMQAKQSNDARRAELLPIEEGYL